jgi:hypothetical protein
VNELFDSVNVTAEIKRVLPSEVSGLASPATAGLRALAIQVAPQVLATATVQNAWRLANRTAQLELLRILNGGNRTLSTSEGVVSLQLHPLLTQLAAQLGLSEQLQTARSNLSGSTGTAARGAVQEHLGVTIPQLSGNIVILRSSQLRTAQNIVKAIRGLAIVLPAIAILLFLLAVRMAVGRRRVAVRTTGLCLIAIGLIVVLARRLIGDALVDSLVKVSSQKPAAHDAYAIGTSLLYDSAVALITYGAAIVAGAWMTGSTRPAFALRRALAPALREYPHYVYAAAGLALLLVVIWGPFPSTREPLPVIGIAALLALGIRALRRATAREFPSAELGETARAVRTWMGARRHAAFQTFTAAFPGGDGGAGAGAPGNSAIADLERLASLHHRGDLTDEEFTAQKALVINRGS